MVSDEGSQVLIHVVFFLQDLMSNDCGLKQIAADSDSLQNLGKENRK